MHRVWLMHRDPDAIASVGEWIRWNRYWHVQRRINRFPARLAHKLPEWLKRAVYIEVVARATTRGRLAGQHPMGATTQDIFDDWKSNV